MFSNRRKNNKCYVCGSKDENKSYFGFPSEKSIRIQWSTFCQLKLEDIRVSYKICHEHFEPQDFRSNKLNARRWLLKKDAVPKILEGNTSNVGVRVRKKKQCCLCGNRSEFVSFKFPEDLNLRKKWLEFCGTQADPILPSHRLCSRHFLLTDFEGGIRKKLKKDAIPTVAKDDHLERTETSNNSNESSTSNSVPKNLEDSASTAGVPVRKPQRSCYLCGRSSERVSSFKFPEDINLREKWLKFCGAQASWIRPSYRLCAKHFLPLDIDNGVIPRLKRNAVPSVAVDSDDSDDDFETTDASNNRSSKMFENTRHCYLCGTVRDRITFEFPKSDELKQKWITAMGLEGQIIPEFATICTKHFSDDSYEKFGWSNRTKLKENVVPSIFTTSQLEFAKEYLTRKRKNEDDFEISCIVEIYEDAPTTETDIPARAKDPESDIQNIIIPVIENSTLSKSGDPKNNVKNSIQPVKRKKMDTERVEGNTDKSKVKNDTSVKKTSTRVEGCRPEAQKLATIHVVQSKSNISKTKNAKLKPSPGKRKPEETETSSSISAHLIDHQYGVDNDSVAAVLTDTSVSIDLSPIPSSEPDNQETLENVVPNEKLKKRYRYVGDFRPADFQDPKKVERCFKTLRETLKEKNKNIKILRQKVRRLETKVGDLKSLVNYLYKLSHK